jgi:hypothetical protein
MKFIKKYDLLFGEKIGIDLKGNLWLYSTIKPIGWNKLLKLSGKNQDGFETEIVFQNKKRLLCIKTMSVG